MELLKYHELFATIDTANINTLIPVYKEKSETTNAILKDCYALDTGDELLTIGSFDVLSHSDGIDILRHCESPETMRQLLHRQVYPSFSQWRQDCWKDE